MILMVIHSILRAIVMLATPLAIQGDAPVPVGADFSARDSLPAPTDDSPDALNCLKGLSWEASDFHVRCVTPKRVGSSAEIQFPSAILTEHDQNNRVFMEWYAPGDFDGVTAQPAMVVVHESGRGMTVGRMVARGLRDRGINAFMIYLPFYGSRRPPHQKTQDLRFSTVMKQGIADVRRSLDAVRAIPGIDRDRISLQGTSLGGFLAATTAGLDDAFHRTFVLLAGGDLPKLIETGQRETAQLRDLLKTQGYEGNSAFALLNRFEPNRLAHRIDPKRLWLYSATFDTVVPPAHCASFAQAAGLEESHHIRMPATHVSGIVFMPLILDQIAVKAGGRSLASSGGDTNRLQK